jgi:hypothetical protein
MAGSASFVVPVTVLKAALYAAAPPVEGGSRPSGSSLTGNDLKLLWLVLSHFAASPAKADRPTTINILQRDIGRMMGRVHPERLAASLDRLRGTDVFLGVNVMPALVAYERAGEGQDEGQDERIWTITLDTRLLRHVWEEPTLSIPFHVLERVSSRYSVILYGRFVAWKSKELPAERSIIIGAHPKGRAFEMRVPVAMLPRIFGNYDAMAPSEIRKLLVTTSKVCPLKRELASANVAVDTTLLMDEISRSRVSGLKLLISDVLIEGLRDLAAEREHRILRAQNRKVGGIPVKLQRLDP